MKKLAALALCAAAAAAQHHHAQSPGHKAVELIPGLGIWKHPISARSREVQQFFDQGLVLLYGFNRPEALRSFRKALEIDPGAAMAQWGVSMALGPYLNMDIDPGVNTKEACKAAEDGLTITGAGEMEKGWLRAAAARCPNYSDPAPYIDAMRGLAARYPDDPDAQTFFAEALLLPVRWHWYSGDGKPAAGVEEAERVLEGVLRRYPDHPGANHLYIHAVESSPTPERGIASAQRLMGIVPAAGHMVHMPSHIWLALGDYSTTVDVNERAAAVDRAYFANTGGTNGYYPYYLHNLQFIVYARWMQGRAADTRKAAADMAAGAKAMPEMADMVAVFSTFARLRIADWDALLAAQRPDSPLARTFWHYSRAIALQHKGDDRQAREEQRQFELARALLDRNMPWDTNKLGDVLDLASAALDARLEHSGTAAILKWRKAAAIQDALAYDEPPAWYYPLRESLGAALFLGGDAAGAEAVFREGLRRSPKNGRMLFGLLASLKAQNKLDAAVWVEREYQAAWKSADIQLRMPDL